MEESLDRQLVSVWSMWEKLEATWCVRVLDREVIMPYPT